jgi:hypothetical protein
MRLSLSFKTPWTRDALRSSGELVHGLERIRYSYRELRDGEPDTDCEVGLRQAERALKAAEEPSLSLDGPGSVNRTKRSHLAWSRPTSCTT